MFAPRSSKWLSRARVLFFQLQSFTWKSILKSTCSSLRAVRGLTMIPALDPPRLRPSNIKASHSSGVFSSHPLFQAFSRSNASRRHVLLPVQRNHISESHGALFLSLESSESSNVQPAQPLSLHQAWDEIFCVFPLLNVPNIPGHFRMSEFLSRKEDSPLSCSFPVTISASKLQTSTVCLSSLRQLQMFQNPVYARWMLVEFSCTSNHVALLSKCTKPTCSVSMKTSALPSATIQNSFVRRLMALCGLSLKFSSTLNSPACDQCAVVELEKYEIYNLGESRPSSSHLLSGIPKISHQG